LSGTERFALHKVSGTERFALHKVSGTERFALHTVNKHCTEKRKENQEDFRKFQLQKDWD